MGDSIRQMRAVAPPQKPAECVRAATEDKTLEEAVKKVAAQAAKSVDESAEVVRTARKMRTTVPPTEPDVTRRFEALKPTPTTG